MGIEQRLSELARIQRPFSHPFPAMEDNAYLIDNTFAFRRIGSFHGGKHVAFVADRQLPILRENAKKDKESHGTGIGILVLPFTLSQRVIYLGDTYKFSLSKDQRYFQLQSASPINIEPVSKNRELKALVAQRTQPASA